MEQYIMLIVIVVVFGGMMWWQSKKAKQQQQEKQDFRRNLQPGTEVITIGQVIGKVVEVDEQYGGDRSSTPKAPSCVSASMPSPVSTSARPMCPMMRSTRTATRCPTKTPRLRLTMRLVRFRSRRPSCPRKTPLTRPVTTTKPRRSKLFDSVAPSAYRIAKA